MAYYEGTNKDKRVQVQTDTEKFLLENPNWKLSQYWRSWSRNPRLVLLVKTPAWNEVYRLNSSKKTRQYNNLEITRRCEGLLCQYFTNQNSKFFVFIVVCTATVFVDDSTDSSKTAQVKVTFRHHYIYYVKCQRIKIEVAKQSLVNRC